MLRTVSPFEKIADAPPTCHRRRPPAHRPHAVTNNRPSHHSRPPSPLHRRRVAPGAPQPPTPSAAGARPPLPLSHWPMAPRLPRRPTNRMTSPTQRQPDQACTIAAGDPCDPAGPPLKNLVEEEDSRTKCNFQICF
jgi:hypothetical protein